MTIRGPTGSRAIYGSIGFLCGMAIGVLLSFIWSANEFSLTTLPISGMALALWYGERTGAIPTADEANRPITLFPQDCPDRKR